MQPSIETCLHSRALFEIARVTYKIMVLLTRSLFQDLFAVLLTAKIRATFITHVCNVACSIPRINVQWFLKKLLFITLITAALFTALCLTRQRLSTGSNNVSCFVYLLVVIYRLLGLGYWWTFILITVPELRETAYVLFCFWLITVSSKVGSWAQYCSVFIWIAYLMYWLLLKSYVS